MPPKKLPSIGKRPNGTFVLPKQVKPTTVQKAHVDAMLLAAERERENKARMARMRKDKAEQRKSQAREKLDEHRADINAYATLGVSRNASEADIKAAYRKQSLKYHPDKGGSHEKFLSVKNAYDSLIDKKIRGMINQLQPRQKKTKKPSGDNSSQIIIA
eukprot:gene26409-31911_t